MESIYKKITSGVTFPKFKGGLLYMHKTRMDNVVLPKEYAHYKKTIENILSKVADKNNVCYITIDEKEVCNQTHRREGIHVDFNWFEGIGDGQHSGHKRTIGMHTGDPGHRGNSGGGHNGNGNHLGGHNGSSGGTHNSFEEFNKNGGMLLVSNYPGCKVYGGKYSGIIGDGGDCKDIDVSKMKSEIMQPNEVYYLNALGVHEPLLIKDKVKRSLVRINFHPEYIMKYN